jgi:two-component system response regulator AtoC
VDPAAAEALKAYDWPGNVRELENVMERACILVDDDRVTLEDLPPEITKITPGSVSGNPEGGHESGTLREMLRGFEFQMIAQAIEEAGGDRRRAAQRLGIGLSSLYRKLEEYHGPGVTEPKR